jgi:hypothetical protein
MEPPLMRRPSDCKAGGPDANTTLQVTAATAGKYAHNGGHGHRRKKQPINTVENKKHQPHRCSVSPCGRMRRCDARTILPGDACAPGPVSTMAVNLLEGKTRWSIRMSDQEGWSVVNQSAPETRGTQRGETSTEQQEQSSSAPQQGAQGSAVVTWPCPIRGCSNHTPCGLWVGIWKQCKTKFINRQKTLFCYGPLQRRGPAPPGAHGVVFCLFGGTNSGWCYGPCKPSGSEKPFPKK